MGRSCSSCACAAASYVLALLLANNALQVSVHIQDGPVASDNKHAPEVLDTFFGTYRTGEADISQGMKTGMPIKLAADDFVQTVRVLLAGLFMLLPLTWLLPSLAPNRDDPDVETALLERERPRPPMTNLSNDLDFIDLELGISEPVAIEPPLQAEVDDASDDPQAVSASEVASETEVDHASDDPQAVSASEVASKQPHQTEVDDASDDRQAMSALDVGAIEQPLQTEADHASDDPQAMSDSEVASEQPLQTEVDEASDDPQAVSASEVASKQPLQTEVDDASDDPQAVSASEVASKQPLQTEVDDASDDPQAVSASEVVSKQPLQTEVDDAPDDPQAVSASEVASKQPHQTEVDDASDDRQAMSALDVVAIEQPLQTEADHASDDPQAMSDSEVASEQPLQTEVDDASDDPQAVSASEVASEQPFQTVDGDIDEVEDCWGSSDEEEEDEEETEERIDDTSRDELILHSSTMALRVDALEARDVHEEAARIVMARLDHLSGAQGQELDEDSAASLLDPQLVMFGAVKVIGGLMLKSICNGRGWEVTCRGDLVFYF